MRFSVHLTLTFISATLRSKFVGIVAMEGQLSVSVRSKWKSMLHHIVRSAGSKVDYDSNSFPSFSSHVVVSDRRFMHLFQQPSCRPFKSSRFLRENWCLISGDCTASSKASFMLVRTGMPRQNHSLTARRQECFSKKRLHCNQS